MLPESARKVLFIHQGALGDLVLSLPALASFREFYPNAHFEIAGFPRILSLIEGRYYADKVVSIDGSDWSSLYLEKTEIPQRLVNYLSDFDMGVVFAANPNQVFGENLRLAGIKYVFQIRTVPPNGKKIHVINYILSSANDVGLEILHTPPRLYLRRPERLFADGFLKGNSIDGSKMLVAIHPGSGGKKKVWMHQRFEEVMYELSGKINPVFLIICGPTDELFVEPILANTHLLNPILIKDIPLVRVASIIEKCRIYIGNDSGITHMATAIGKPTVALYGPTDPDIWGPKGPYVSVLAPGIPCSPCNKETLSLCTSPACLAAISVKDVLNTTLEFLKV